MQEFPIENEIWILADNRAGNYSQAIGLAAEIGQQYRIINITYNCFAFLPNFLTGPSLLIANAKSKKKLAEFKYFPKLIIAAGRRSAMISLYLKNQSQKRTKIVQIMNPQANQDDFDLIVTPRHDKIAGKNIEKTMGSLTKINEIAINLAKEQFWQWFGDIKKPKIAVIIGGSSKNSQFEKKSAIKLAKKVSEIAKNMNAILLVINSRRTGDKITAIVKENLSGDFKFFDWKKIRAEENPYLAIVGFSDFFIVTADSVSMISETCSTGKPVYIFDEKNISTPKHRSFHQALLDENYIKKIDEKTAALKDFSSKKLNETKRVAEIILKKIL